MSSTSQKHRNFVAEPMGEKPVTGETNFRRFPLESANFTIHEMFVLELAGIGETLGKRLTDKGFDKVSYLACTSDSYLSLFSRHTRFSVNI